jgi:hypothetical protein
MSDNTKAEKAPDKIRIKLRTKHGRTFRRLGQVIGPEKPTELDVTPEQLEALKPDCRPLADGGVLELVVVGKAPPPAGADKPRTAADKDKA